MTSAVVNQTGRIRTYKMKDVPITATAIFTALQNYGETSLELLVSNKNAAIKKVTVEVYTLANTTSYSQVTNYPIPIGGQYRCDFPVQMLAGDEIRLTAETASTLDALLTVSEGIGRGG